MISLAWVSTPGSDPVLVAGTQGGLLVRWSWSDDGPARALPPLAEKLGMVTVVMPVPGGDGMRVLAGDTHGGLAVYDAVGGSLVHDLTRDDARVIGATVVAASPPVVVTGHSADGGCGLKVWNPETGGQSGAVVHRSRAHDAFVGPPRAAGRPTVGRSSSTPSRTAWSCSGWTDRATTPHRYGCCCPSPSTTSPSRATWCTSRAGRLSDAHRVLSGGRGRPAGAFAG